MTAQTLPRRREVRAHATCGAVLISALAVLTGCEGAIAGPTSSGDAPSAGTAGSGGVVTGSDPNAVGPRPLTRLSRREYNNTVRDLLGDTTRPADAFPDDHDRAFLFRRAGLVATQDAELLRSAAETLAAAALKNPSKLLPCDPATGEQACAERFIADVGKRAYRRPLSTAETARLVGLYQSARTTQQLSFNDAIGLLLEAMLQSPAFLYHWESPYEAPRRQGAAVELGGYDVASRLSYFIWGSMPDQALFDAAAAGKLATEADVEEQARRMLADDRAKDAVAAFFREWLELEQLPQLPKDAATYPEYDGGLKSALVGETEAFVKSVLFGGDGKLETLLTAGYSYSNQALAGVYGTNATGSAFMQVTLPPSERLGLLTHPSFLTVTGAPNGSNPIKRGKAIYERLLCGELPPPPPNVPAAKPASAGGTTRQRFAEHAENACAKGCHSLMDPLGFAFESYDGIGRYRTMDNGQPVDATGAVRLDGVEQPFSNALDLARLLATSEQVRGCFAKQWFRFAMGRKETDADAPSLSAVASAFGAHQFDVRELAPAIASSRSFRLRSLAAGEVTP
jgi:Protein of unknown function (DUF1592)/Protein of unknown function (DUF1588)/Protein of unknown function (DUF1595)/Protein of unknown function (DUF1585)/Protein of unknown function (DUF1587)